MSLLQRLFSRPDREVAKQTAVTSAASDPAISTVTIRAGGVVQKPIIEARAVQDILRVEETTDAEFYAGDLFRRRFGSDPPDYPKHYVALYRQGRSGYLSVGYIHYTAFEDSYLCGGMVIDDRLYRRIPAPHRRLIRDAGGIAEIMLRETFARLAHSPAIWGHVGDKQAEEVNLRVGFVHTHHPHVMVVWNADLAAEERGTRLERVIALGPF